MVELSTQGKSYFEDGEGGLLEDSPGTFVWALTLRARGATAAATVVRRILSRPGVTGIIWIAYVNGWPMEPLQRIVYFDEDGRSYESSLGCFFYQLDRVVLADFHQDPSGYGLIIYNHTGKPDITIAVEDNVGEGGT